MAAAEASQEREIEQEQRSGQAPVDVTCPVDLAVDPLLGVGNGVMLLGNDVLVERDAVAASLWLGQRL